MPDTAMCENDHGTERWAVALLHLSDSTSAANVIALCEHCLAEWLDEWLDAHLHGQADAYEIRPLDMGGCPDHDGALGPHHNDMCALYEPAHTTTSEARA